MSKDSRITVQQALKTALADVARWAGFIVLVVVLAVTMYWLASTSHTLLLRYYPVHTALMTVTACVMVPVLIMTTEVLARTRHIAGDSMPRRLQLGMDIAIVMLLVVQLVTVCVLAWMVLHAGLAVPGVMLPIMVVCCFVQAVSSVLRIKAGWAGW